MKPPSRFGRSDAGAALVYAILAASIIGLILAGMTGFVQNRTAQRRLTSLSNARKLAWDSVMINAGSPDALRVSMANAFWGNVLLRGCVRAGDGLWCNSTDSNAPVPFRLFAPMANGANIRVTHENSTSPLARFNLRGMREPVAASADVPYWAQSTFFATCPGIAFGGNCDRASRIYVQTAIRPSPGFTNPGGVRFSQFPLAAELANARTPANRDTNPLMARVWTSDILGAAVQQCPKNAYMSGVDSGGFVICRCEQGFQQVGMDPGTKLPICAPIAACPPGQILAGMDLNGNAFCRTPPPTTTVCWDSPTLASSGDVHCPAAAHNTWKMRKVQVSNDCEVISDIVHCNFMKITCCREI